MLENILFVAANLFQYIVRCIPGAIVLFIMHLLGQISKLNPFDRVIGRKHYRVSNTFGNEIVLRKGKRTTEQTLETAIAEFDYLYPHQKRLRIVNPVPLSFEWSYLDRLQSLENLDISEYTLYGNEIFQIPERFSYLTVPNNADRLYFDAPSLSVRSIWIPANHVIPAGYWGGGIRGFRPVVRDDFRIVVPEALLQAYIDDESWRSILFVRENGERVCSPFVSYEEIRPLRGRRTTEQ